MLEMFQLPFMVQALIACVMLAVILSYFGVHVVTRGIVFIDLALAQISAAGVAFALLMNGDPRLYAIGFTLIGAFLFSALKTGNKRVPQEAVIGIIYAVASAIAILLISKTPHADADVTASILFGNILAITSQQIVEMAVVFGIIAILLAVFTKKLVELSLSHGDHQAQNPSVTSFNLLNLMFYLSLALVISYAINAAGVLLVFSFLIVPAVCALLVFNRMRWVFLLAAMLGVIASVMGLSGSYMLDLPPGASIVVCFGLIFFLTSLVAFVRRSKSL